jgi:hypothetical protein
MKTENPLYLLALNISCWNLTGISQGVYKKPVNKVILCWTWIWLRQFWLGQIDA